MRKIIAALVVSVDGFIEGPVGELDWVNSWQDRSSRRDRGQWPVHFAVASTTPNPFDAIARQPPVPDLASDEKNYLRALAAAASSDGRSVNERFVLFHTRRISSSFSMVFDFTSPNCRCASTPAAVMSRATTSSRSFIELLKLGWVGALLGRPGESPGVGAVRDLGVELSSCDRGGSDTLAAGPAG